MCVRVCVDKLQTRLLSLGSKVPASSRIEATSTNYVMQIRAAFMRSLHLKLDIIKIKRISKSKLKQRTL